VPIEVGAIIFQPSKGWQVFAVNDDDIFGPGSLNRFMKQAVFKRDVADPTSFNPPQMVLAGSFASKPGRDDFDDILAKAVFSARRNLSTKYAKENVNSDELSGNSADMDFSSAVDARQYILSNFQKG
jgi:hypothetical protein